MIGLIGAAAIGLLVGLSLEEDTKERIANDIKNRLYYKMMTGQEYQPWHKAGTGHATYHTTYSRKSENKWAEKWNEVLTFNDPIQAKEGMSRIKNIAARFGYVSVYDLYVLRGLATEWVMNKYGWTEEMIRDKFSVSNKIHLPAPIEL
jgi:hypothetical protein